MRKNSESVRKLERETKRAYGDNMLTYFFKTHKQQQKHSILNFILIILQIYSIFGNFYEVYQMNEQFLRDLQKAMTLYVLLLPLPLLPLPFPHHSSFPTFSPSSPSFSSPCPLRLPDEDQFNQIFLSIDRLMDTYATYIILFPNMFPSFERYLCVHLF